MILEKQSKLKLYPYLSSLTIEEVILGVNFNSEREKIVSEYVEELISFLSERNEEFDVVLPSCFTELNNRTNKELINTFSFKYKNEIINDRGVQKVKINFPFEELKRVFHVFEGQILIAPGIEPEAKQFINDILIEILSSSFENRTKTFGTYSDRNKPNLSAKSLKCFSSPQYVEWCVINIDDFILSEEIINQEYVSAKLESFELVPINHKDNDSYTHFTYDNGIGLDFDEKETILFKPIISERTFKFSQKAIEINHTKLLQFKHKESLKKSDERYFVLLSYTDSIINETDQRVMVTEFNEVELLDRDLPISGLRPYNFNNKKTHTIIMAWDTPKAESVRSKLHSSKLTKIDLNKCFINYENNNGTMELIHYYFDVKLPSN